MLTTDCGFLENELMDVVRLFKSRPQSVTHAFRFDGGVFYNDFVVDGKAYSFKDEGQGCDEIEFKRLERRFGKLGLYAVLSELYKEDMPWGALTGIRPTKMAYTEKEAGRPFRPLFEKMRVKEENIALVEEVLRAQEGIYEKKDGNTDFFVSIPFCPTKCSYCSFITAPIDKTRGFLPDYLDCLEREIFAAAPLTGNLRSVYIGGGTPLVLESEALERVLKAVERVRTNGCEYTVEAGRPDVFTEEKLRLLKEYGVTRICVNPQSFSDKTLERIGRRHTAAELYRAFDMAAKFGFDVNADLIAGLTDETYEEFVFSVNEAVRTGAANITVHCLSLKSGAKLKEECSYLENPLVSDMVAASREILRTAGYVPYYMYRQKYQTGNNENVGWTKAGKACVYNIDIMEETADNLAVGANAVSKRVYNLQNRIERFASQKDLKTYIGKIDEIIARKNKFFGQI
ncbi:MAG: coproporphyrinogen dehydrogenase HemZ [Christensenellaceae bacterium]|jgi:coproporphyrinogen dehydrogenase hemZ|nr:coproporphyrinogen dehydrogenase HemZ [Clostridia bacterium]PWL97741.1 MAG: coproporphyrinogen dehydrogenase HemZ [Clostridiales bacterium]